jgi:hypothetical protein
MIEKVEAPRRLWRPFMRRFWAGRGRPVFRLRLLIVGLLFSAVGIGCYRIALIAARWSGLIKIIAVLLLIVSIVLLWQAGTRLWQFVAHLGARGVLIALALPLIAFYILAGLSLDSGLGWRGRWALAQILTQRVGEQLGNGVRTIITVPDDLALAFFGRGLSGWDAQPSIQMTLDAATFTPDTPIVQQTTTASKDAPEQLRPMAVNCAPMSPQDLAPPQSPDLTHRPNSSCSKGQKKLMAGNGGVSAMVPIWAGARPNFWLLCSVEQSHP